MMFKFGQLHKKGNLSLHDICDFQSEILLRKTAEKYRSSGKVLNVFDVFDRRADRTKGATERNRGDAPPTALDFSANLETNFDERIPNYSSQWKDREYGRKKLQLLIVII